MIAGFEFATLTTTYTQVKACYHLGASSRIPWVLDTPKGIRAEACFEASKNLGVPK
jgi:hypothetical protein